MTTDLFGVEQQTSSGISGHERSRDGGDEWLTPPNIIDTLGPFDLDPCAPRIPPFANARRHFSIEDDGLRQAWAGRVWLNPPYSTAAIWLRRLSEHNGGGTALMFARTDTRAWHDWVWPKASAFLFLKGRVTFHLSDGRRASAPAGAPSVLIAYGDRDAEILRESAPILVGHFIPNGGHA